MPSKCNDIHISISILYKYLEFLEIYNCSNIFFQSFIHLSWNIPLARRPLNEFLLPGCGKPPETNHPGSHQRIGRIGCWTNPLVKYWILFPWYGVKFLKNIWNHHLQELRIWSCSTNQRNNGNTVTVSAEGSQPWQWAVMMLAWAHIRFRNICVYLVLVLWQLLCGVMSCHRMSFVQTFTTQIDIPLSSRLLETVHKSCTKQNVWMMLSGPMPIDNHWCPSRGPYSQHPTSSPCNQNLSDDLQPSQSKHHLSFGLHHLTPGRSARIKWTKVNINITI